MFKCIEVDKIDFNLIENMDYDTVYKQKNKALIAYREPVCNYLRVYWADFRSQISDRPYGGTLGSKIESIYCRQRLVNSESDIPNDELICEDTRTLDEILKYAKREINRAYPKRTEIGVELELEPEQDYDTCYSNSVYDTVDKIEEIDKTKLVERVKCDCSVFGGTELNLKHMSLNKWSKSGIKELLTKLRESVGLDNRYGTAGMHVHVSGPRLTTASRQAYKHYQDIGNFLNLIGFRRKQIEIIDCEPGYDKDGDHLTRYGIGTDAIRCAFNSHGTVEFRCFEVTTDYDLFMTRIEFCKELFAYLGKDLDIKDFAKKASKRARELFLKLYNDSRNPHAQGTMSDEELKLMEA